MGWNEFLDFLQGPGISIVVGVILSLVIEYWPKFQALEPKWKQLVFAGLCFVVPLLGALGMCVSGFAVWGDWSNLWWPALVNGGSAFFSGSMTHRADNAVRNLVE